MLENKKPIITLLCINALLAVVLIFSSFQSQPTQTKVEFVDDPLAKNKSDALEKGASTDLECVGHEYTERVPAPMEQGPSLCV